MTSIILDRQCRNCKCGIRATYQYCPHCGKKQEPMRFLPREDDYFKPALIGGVVTAAAMLLVLVQ